MKNRFKRNMKSGTVGKERLCQIIGTIGNVISYDWIATDRFYQLEDMRSAIIIARSRIRGFIINTAQTHTRVNTLIIYMNIYICKEFTPEIYVYEVTIRGVN